MVKVLCRAEMMVGKTIKKIVSNWEVSRTSHLFVFEDNTIFAMTGTGDSAIGGISGGTLELDNVSLLKYLGHSIVEAGFVTEAEFTEYHDKRRASEAAALDDADRREYARLKAKFEVPEIPDG